MSWTKEQLAAIETENCNLLVSAAAGSGKTAVLVERIIRKVTKPDNPVDIDRLLIVTFTNAAAAEMRERIGKAIIKKMEERPQDTHLQKQMTLIHRASIMTIHAFCLEVIRNHFHFIDLDPQFRIGTETEMKLLKDEILEELLEDWYQKEENSIFLELVESYGGKKRDTPLEEILLRIYHFIQSHPWPEFWLQEKIEAFNITQKDHGLEETPWVHQIKEQLGIECESYLASIEQALKICNQPGGPVGYEEALQSDYHLLQQFQQALDQDLSTLWKAFEKISFVRLGRCSKETNKNLQEKVKSIREDIKKGIEDLQEKIFFQPFSEIQKDIKRLYPLLKCLKELILDFSNRFQNHKKEKNILDFNDIEHYALQILVQRQEDEIIPTVAAYELQERYEEILIDEYQDSNLVQETILRSISKIHQGQPNLFMVGDVKQSIYRFRLAKPELFIEKYQAYEDKNQTEGKRIDLSKNFRSREEILAGTNFIFKQLMSEYLGEIVYNEDAALYVGAAYPQPSKDIQVGGSIELHIMEKDSLSEDDFSDSEESQDIENHTRVELEQLSQIELEGRMVAQKIQQLIYASQPEYQIWDAKEKKYRKVEYRDIVILLRTTHQWASVFQEQLTRYNIPVYTDATAGYFDSIEVKTILNVLHIIDNPRQDLPLIAVLRSPIVGFNANELVDIRTELKEGSFYDAIQVYCNGLRENQDIVLKLEEFLIHLNQWRKWATYMPIDELLWNVYLDTHYYYYVGAMPGGLQRQANLRVLLDRAKEYEQGSYTGLFQFIRFIEKVQRNQGDLGAPQILGENENLVKIMSIHKSKGLEFPIVFVSGLGKGFNLSDLYQPILLHQDLGLGPVYVDFNRRISTGTLPRTAIYQKIRRENLSEEMRILYVAFTRAKEKLILTGTVKNIEQAIVRWSQALGEIQGGINPYHLLKGKNYLDWIGSALIRHKDGKLLRQWAQVEGGEEEFIKDGSSWEIYKWNKEDIEQEENDQDEFLIHVKKELNHWNVQREYSQQKKEVIHRLTWEYPYKELVPLPVKTSVSEIKRKFQQEEEGSQLIHPLERTLPAPSFLQEKKSYTGVEKGTLFHFVLQHLQLHDALDFQSILSQLQDMVNQGLLTEEEKQVISISHLVSFSRSPLAERMRKALLLKKEVPFVMGVPVETLYSELQVISEEEFILVQGMIDCYFEEEDGIVLVDYKTDFVPDGNIEIIKKRYQIQMDLYTKAIEQITGKKVKEKILYLFSVNETVNV